MEKATVHDSSKHTTLVLRQDGANASLPNGLGFVLGEHLPLLDGLDFPLVEELEDTVAVVRTLMPNGLLTDGAGHFGFRNGWLTGLGPF